MTKKCIACGYERQSSDDAPDYECPKCGRVYVKLEIEQKQRDEEEEERRKSLELKCRYCGSVVTFDDVRCPKCGKEPFRPIGEEIGGVLTIAALLLIPALIFYIFFMPDVPNDNVVTTSTNEAVSQTDIIGAYTACQMLVERKLKSPSSSNFPAQPRNSSSENGIYTIQSHVDSKNSFNAMIRTHWICQIKKEGENWISHGITFVN